MLGESLLDVIDSAMAIRQLVDALEASGAMSVDAAAQLRGNADRLEDQLIAIHTEVDYATIVVDCATIVVDKGRFVEIC